MVKMKTQELTQILFPGGEPVVRFIANERVNNALSVIAKELSLNSDEIPVHGLDLELDAVPLQNKEISYEYGGFGNCRRCATKVRHLVFPNLGVVVVENTEWLWSEKEKEAKPHVRRVVHPIILAVPERLTN